MAANDSLGDLTVSVTGDFSELESAIQGAVGKAEDGAQAIQGALNIPTAGDAVSQAFTNVGDAAAGAAGQLGLFDDAAKGTSTQMELFDGFVPSLSEHIEQVGTAAVSAATGLTNAGDAAGHAAESAHEAESAFGELGGELLKAAGLVIGIEKAFELVKDTVTEAFQAFSQVQTATTALTALTKNAEGARETIENLKTLAISDALSFPTLVQATQRMTAFGIATEDIPRALQGAADAAAATGTPFDAVVTKLGNIALSGNAGARQLTQLGLGVQDLARVMGVSMDQVKDAFKALEDPSQRMEVLVQAMGKFGGTAQQVAQGIGQQWTNLKTELDFALEDIGKGLAPFGEAFISAAKQATDSAKGITAAFADLSSSLSSTFSEIKGTAGSFWDALIPKDIQSKIPGIGQMISQTLIGPIKEELQFATTQVNNFKNGLTGLLNLMGHGSSEMANALADALKRSGQAAADANTATLSLGKAYGTLLTETQGAEDAQTKAADAVHKAADALAEEKARLDAGQGSLGAYTRLLNDYDKAVQAAAPHGKDFAESVAGITQALNDAQGKYTTALASFQKIQTAYDQGKASAELLAAAEKKLDDAYAAINPKLKDHADGIQAIFEQTAKARAAWIDAQDTLRQMADALKNGEASALDFNVAVAQAARAAEAAGVAFGDPGSGMAGALTVLAQAGDAAAVTINGKVVAAMNELADVAPSVTQSMQDVGASIQDAGTKTLTTGEATKALADDWVQCKDAVDSGLPVILRMTGEVQDQADAVSLDADAISALVDKYYAAADAAGAAATATNSLAEAERNEESAASSSSGGGGGGKASKTKSDGSGSSDILGHYGASILTIAQQNPFWASLVFGSAGGDLSQFTIGRDINSQISAINTELANQMGAVGSGTSTGSMPSWQKTFQQKSASGNDPSAAVSNLGSAASSAATAVSGFGSATSGTIPVVQALSTAAGNAATPLGAFVTGVGSSTDATDAQTQMFKSLTAISISLSAAQKQQAESGNAYLQVLSKTDPALQAFADKSLAATQAQEKVTEASNALAAVQERDFQLVENGQITLKQATEDLSQYNVALQQASDVLNTLGTGIVDLTDAVSKASDAQRSSSITTNAAASDYYTVQEKASGVVSASSQAYDEASARSENANNALAKAFADMRAGVNVSSDALAALTKEWSTAADALHLLIHEGPTGTGDASHTVTTGLAGPDTLSPSTPPTGTSGLDAATGQWEWDYGKKAWVWNPAAKGALSQSGLGSKQFDPMQNIDAFDPARGTGGMGGLITNTASGGTTIQVIVQGGTYIGANAGKQLADLAMPEVVAGLRRSGAKI